MMQVLSFPVPLSKVTGAGMGAGVIASKVGSSVGYKVGVSVGVLVGAATMTLSAEVGAVVVGQHEIL
jgi:hypothetical protein